MLFITELQNILDKINKEESSSIFQAVKVCADSIESKHAVFLFGAGHSALPCMEAFPRIGSFVGFIQITEPSLGFNGYVIGKGGQKQMSFLEQTSGFAEIILSNYTVGKGDTLITFSNSGINALPVEMAVLAKEKGMQTIGVGSFLHAQANTPKNSYHKHLHEVTDIFIDNHTPVGDALIPLENGKKLGGSSTITEMIIMNTIVVETGQLLYKNGFSLNIYPSHNVSENTQDVINEEEQLFDAYKQLLAKY